MRGRYNRSMRILLTNDDGIEARGIRILRQALLPLGEVFLVAPERPRSASGHSITLHKPLRLREISLEDGSIWSSNGTPSDCVTLGFDVVMEGKADLVFSGINQGPNLGWDLTYSGTVSAAMEGAIAGVQSVAISVAWRFRRMVEEEEGPPPPIDYTWAAKYAVDLAHHLERHRLPDHTLL